MNYFAELMSVLQESATFKAGARAKAALKTNPDHKNLTLGQLGFKTEDFIIEAAIKAYRDGWSSKYAPVQGIFPLREAVSEIILWNEQDIDLSPDDILITNGGKEAIFLALMTLINPGDSVILFKPAWVSYEAMVRVLGGEPIFVNCDENYHVDMEDFRLKMGPHIKAVIFNGISNPTGVVQPSETLKAIASLCALSGAAIVSDETYSGIEYGEDHYQWLAGVADELPEMCMSVFTASKRFGLTGSRVGIAAGTSQWIKKMTKLKGQLSSGANHVAQFETLAAVKSQGFVKERVLKLNESRRYVTDALTRMGLPHGEIGGAFYAFPDVSPLGLTGDDFTEILFQNGVSVTPGEPFGCPNNFRLSYGGKFEDVQVALNVMEACISGF